MDKISNLSQGIPLIFVKRYDPVLLMYYLGPEFLIKNCCEDIEFADKPYLIVGPAQAFSSDETVQFEGCRRHGWPGIGMFILNHAEAYRFDGVQSELDRLQFEIWECREGPFDEHPSQIGSGFSS